MLRLLVEFRRLKSEFENLARENALGNVVGVEGRLLLTLSLVLSLLMCLVLFFRFIFFKIDKQNDIQGYVAIGKELFSFVFLEKNFLNRFFVGILFVAVSSFMVVAFSLHSSVIAGVIVMWAALSTAMGVFGFKV